MGIKTTVEYSQRESGNLMNIVAVVYGVALTAALTSHQEVLIHPLSTINILPFMALSAAGMLTAYSFYTYVLSIGGDSPYSITWSEESMALHGVFRFATDLMLAVICVRLLFSSADVQAGSKLAPRLTGFVFSFVLFFAGAVVVRAVRRKAINWAGLVAAVVFLGFWDFVRTTTATRDFDLRVEAGVILGVVIYCGLNYRFIYCSWIRTIAKQAAAPEQAAAATAGPPE